MKHYKQNGMPCMHQFHPLEIQRRSCCCLLLGDERRQSAWGIVYQTVFYILESRRLVAESFEECLIVVCRG